MKKVIFITLIFSNTFDIKSQNPIINKNNSFTLDFNFFYLFKEKSKFNNAILFNIYDINPFLKIGYNHYSNNLKRKNNITFGIMSLNIYNSSNPVRNVDVFDTTNSVRLYKLSQRYKGYNLGYTFSYNYGDFTNSRIYYGLGFNMLILKLKSDNINILYDDFIESISNSNKVGLYYTSYQLFGNIEIESKKKIINNMFKPNAKVIFGTNFFDIANTYDFQNNAPKKYFLNLLISFNYEF